MNILAKIARAATADGDVVAVATFSTTAMPARGETLPPYPA
jgi:hypothetical protein